MPSNYLILCRPLLLPPSIFPRIRVFSNESVLHIRWPKYRSFSFSISPSSEHSELISFRMDWLDLLTDAEMLTPASRIPGPYCKGWGVTLPALCLSSHPPALSTWLDVNKSRAPTCDKEMKNARWRMAEVQAGKIRKPKATNLSAESRCSQPKPLFMPGSPPELSYWQGSRRAGSR